ncbi:uncharacterized protein TRAVEDRAFT_29866 [Trametes versicolor FP-101664 SS1]|uniref:uncharacterized protein n=1 Tax=Trametes versicolor (strain FP-101664) TaxID=717944 RepID=UPI00046221D4|nr:uncharacterized protein TRAVEDRAFT_29866 [Trametes versicolor FP-101664 SS1]EIW58005.1 hypothetical protein TRAVEDRAFT_29866 [Trametes versicolor FP-101664 SS1]
MSEFDAEWDYIYADFDPEELDHGDQDDEWTQERDLAERNREYTPDHQPILRKRPHYRFGHPQGVRVGDVFTYRKDLHKAGVHIGVRHGIHGQKDRGAFSIVLSGGYEDDADRGDTIFYTGAGGREKSNQTGPQVHDQSFEHRMNKTLLRSLERGKPVRVVRGFEAGSQYAPWEGYRYDGLYTVEQAKMQTGRSGFQVCVFELHRLPGQPPVPLRDSTSSDTAAQARAKRATVSKPKKHRDIRGERPSAAPSATPSGSGSSHADPQPPRPKHKSRDANTMNAKPSSSSATPLRPLKRPASPYDDSFLESPTKAARRSASDEGYKSEFDQSIDELVSTVKTSGFRSASPGPSSRPSGSCLSARNTPLLSPRSASTSKVHATAHPTLPRVRIKLKPPAPNPAGTTAPSTSAFPSSPLVKPRPNVHPPASSPHALARSPLPTLKLKGPARPAVSSPNSVEMPSRAPERKPNLEHHFIFLPPPPAPSSLATPSTSPPTSCPSAPIPLPRRLDFNGDSQAGPSIVIAASKAASGSGSGANAGPPSPPADARGPHRAACMPDPIELLEREDTPRVGSQECPIVVDDEISDGPVMASSTRASSVKREVDAMDVDILTVVGATAVV